VTLHPDVPSLLRAHGLQGAVETPIAHDGFSGARMSRLEHEARRYLVKRTSWADDWLMRHSHDREGREALFAASTAGGAPAPGVRTPYVGAARDGTGFAILMQDIGALLLPPAGVLAVGEADRVLAALASLHATADTDTPRTALCGLDERVTILSPSASDELQSAGIDFGAVRGWQEFDRLAPRATRTVIHSIFEDPRSFCAWAAGQPPALLHGDAKLANMGMDSDDVWMFDWSMVMRGPVGTELGWFVAVNASRLPWSPAETLDRYHRIALAQETAPDDHNESLWAEQHALAVLTGMLVLGWGKALDAAGGRADEFAWWCEMTARAGDAFGLR
jgi:hypothetical protein